MIVILIGMIMRTMICSQFNCEFNFFQVGCFSIFEYGIFLNNMYIII